MSWGCNYLHMQTHGVGYNTPNIITRMSKFKKQVSKILKKKLLRVYLNRGQYATIYFIFPFSSCDPKSVTRIDSSVSVYFDPLNHYRKRLV